MENNLDLQENLTIKFNDNIKGFQEDYGLLTAYINPEFNLKIVQYLYDELGFTFLADLTAIHYPNQKGEELTVTYLLYNLPQKLSIRLKLSVDINKPDVYTLSKLFSTANWLERECYDFYGVNFIGHPNLKRIMNVDEMDYFPLRKEYPLEDQLREDKDDDMFGRGAYFSKNN